MVAVLNEVTGSVGSAGAEIDRNHRLGAGMLCPGGELVRAHSVRLDGLPGKIKTPRPLLDRSDTVLPIIAGDEVAAGIA